MIFAQRYNDGGHALSEPTLIDDGDRAYYNARPEWFTWCPVCDTLTAHRSHAAAQDAEDDGHRCVPKPRPKPKLRKNALGWTPAEDQIIASMQPREACRVLNDTRKLQSIYDRRNVLRARGVPVVASTTDRRWTDDETALLATLTAEEVAAATGRSIAAVREYRSRLNRTRKAS